MYRCNLIVYPRWYFSDVSVLLCNVIVDDCVCICVDADTGDEWCCVGWDWYWKFNRGTDTRWLCCDRGRETRRSVTRDVQTRTITITQLIKHHKIWDGDGVEASTRHNMYHDEQLAFRVGCLLCVCSFLTQAWSMYTTSCRCIVSPSYISMLPGLTRKTSMCSFNKWDFPNDMTGTWSLSCRA